jgi:SPP1 family predicted phage head-tail adaptor
VKVGRIRAGTFRQSMILQRRATSTDSEGFSAENWTAVGVPLRAQVTPIGGGESVTAAQMEMKLSHEVKTYWRSDLAALGSASVTAGHNMRLVWGARILDIQMVEDPDGHQRVLLLLCMEHQD